MSSRRFLFLLATVLGVTALAGPSSAEGGTSLNGNCDAQVFSDLKQKTFTAKREWRDGVSSGYVRFAAARQKLLRYAARCGAELGIDMTALRVELEGGIQGLQLQPEADLAPHGGAGQAGTSQLVSGPQAAAAEAGAGGSRRTRTPERQAALDKRIAELKEAAARAGYAPEPPRRDFVAGPDAFGYSVDDSDTNGAINPNFIDIRSSGVDPGFANNTVFTLALEQRLGFPTFSFDFYTGPTPAVLGVPGGTYTTVDVSDNGLLGFGMGGSFPANQCPFAAVGPFNIVAGFWDNLLFAAGGEVDIQTLGAPPNRIFVAQWTDMLTQTGDVVTFQIQLFEGTNDIRVEYLDANFSSSGSASFGIKGPTTLANSLVYQGCNAPGLVHDLLAALYDYPDFADLAIVKFGATTAVAGEPFDYIIQVANTGPNTAADTFFQDFLPAGVRALEVEVADNAEATCTIASLGGFVDNFVICNLGPLPPTAASFREIRIRAVADPGLNDSTGNATETLTNVVTVLSTLTPDPDLANSFDTFDTDVTAEADLSIVKSAADTTPISGREVTFTVTVTNNGPSLAPGVEITDVVPAGLSYLSSDGACVLAAGTVTCTMGDLEPGASATVNLTFQVGRGESCDPSDSTITNTATATLDATVTTDPDPSNDSASVTINPECVADLRIVKFGKPDGEVLAGETVHYTLIVENFGPSSAARVIVRDQLSSSGTYTIANVTLSAGSCVGGCPAGSFGPGTDTFEFALDPAGTLLGVVNAGAGTTQWVIEYDVTALDSQSINNTATVATDPPGSVDPDLTNNEASTSHQITDVADLALGKTATASATAGVTGAVTYVLTVTNNGPSAVQNMVVYDRLPYGVRVESITTGSGSGSCKVGTPGDPSDLLTCGFGNMASGVSDTITIVATIDAGIEAGTVLRNDAWVVSDHFDSNNADNFASATTTVTASSDLAILKFATGTPLAGESGVYAYSILVFNLGPSAAENVLAIDFLPPTMVVESARISIPGQPGERPIDCAFNDGFNGLVCPIGNLPVSTLIPAAIQMNVRVLEAVPPGTSLSNTAIVVSDTTDPDFSNNTSSFAENSVAEADLSITKTASDNTPVAGETLTYTVTVTNLGPSTATSVVLTDALPAQVTYLNDSQGCGAAALAGGTCALGTLPAGASRTVEITTRVVDSTAAGTILSNNASAGSAIADPDGSNNSATNTTVVDNGSDLRITKLGKPDDTVATGGTITYTLFVDNLGPSWAGGVRVVDELRSDGTFTVATVTPDVGVLFGTATCTVNGMAPPQTVAGAATIVCDLGSPLQRFIPGQLGRWTISYTVTATAVQSLNNVASVSASGSVDNDASNNQASTGHRFVESADLSIDKQVNLGTQSAGSALTYTLQVTNSSLTTATNVIVTDYLPEGVRIASIVPGAGNSCTAGVPGDPFRPTVCRLGNVPGGGVETVTVIVTIDPSVEPGALLFNDAEVTSDGDDADLSNNVDSVSTAVTRVADLGLDKITASATATAGGGIQYTLDIYNAGPSDSGPAVIVDTLPAGVTIDAAVVVLGGGTCAVNNGARLVTCSFSDLTPGAARVASVILAGTVASSVGDGAVLTNSATISSTTASEGANALANTDAVDITVSRSSDLAIVKEILDLTPAAGEHANYRLTITNWGPSDAANVTVAEPLSAPLSYLNDDFGCGGAALAAGCNIGTLAAGQSRVINVEALVDPAAACGGVLTNTATVTSSSADAVAGNNSDTVLTYVDCGSDLRVTKVGKPDDTVPTGSTLVYTMTVDNTGPSSATSVQLVEQITASGTFTVSAVNANADGNHGGATCSVAAGTVVSTGLLNFTCAPNATLPPYSAANPSGRWQVQISVTSVVPMSINNQATVTSTSPDSDQSNNVATTQHQFVDYADLSLTKTDAPDPVNAGENVTYTLTVTNNSLTTATNVVLTDALPAGVTIVSVTSAGNTCSAGVPGDAAQPTVCNLGNIGGGASEVTTIVVRVNPGTAPGTILVNGAEVTASTADPNMANNAATATTTVASTADLAVTKTASAASIAAGAKLSYTVTVNNLGPSNALGVTLTDTYPAGLTIDAVIVQIGTGSCSTNVATRTITCNFASLAVSSPAARVLIQATVNPDVADGTVLTNTATVATSGSTDPVAGNNSSSASTTVNAGADLMITITAARVRAVSGTEPTWVDPGDRVRYTITVTNLGTSDATNVEVNVVLPLGVTWQLDDGSCNFDQNGPPPDLNGDCDLDTIAGGESKTFFIEVLTDADAAGFLTTSASVTYSPGVDPNPANNSDSVDIYASYFDDMLIGDPFWPFVQTLRKLDITVGCGARLFCPDLPIRRWEMAVWVEKGMVVAFGENLPAGAGTGLFTDVPVGYPGAAFIEELYNDGITAGCNPGLPLKYCPADFLKRSEMAVFLERAIILFDGQNLPGPATGLVFADVSSGAFAASYIEEFYADKITGGCASNPLRYCPDSATTRGQLAVFIVRAFHLPLP